MSVTRKCFCGLFSRLATTALDGIREVYELLLAGARNPVALHTTACLTIQEAMQEVKRAFAAEEPMVVIEPDNPTPQHEGAMTLMSSLKKAQVAVPLHKCNTEGAPEQFRMRCRLSSMLVLNFTWEVVLAKVVAPALIARHPHLPDPSKSQTAFTLFAAACHAQVEGSANLVSYMHDLTPADAPGTGCVPKGTCNDIMRVFKDCGSMAHDNKFLHLLAGDDGVLLHHKPYIAPIQDEEAHASLSAISALKAAIAQKDMVYDPEIYSVVDDCILSSSNSATHDLVLAAQGVTSPSVIVSSLFTATQIHMEDASLNSINHHGFGMGKLWMKAGSQAASQKFFDHIKSQGLVHEFYTKQLSVRNIPLKVLLQIGFLPVVQHAGQTIITNSSSHALHVTISSGVNVAVSKNMLINKSLEGHMAEVRKWGLHEHHADVFAYLATVLSG